MLYCVAVLNNACFRESGECAVLLDVLEALGGDVDKDGRAEFCDEDATLLEVCLTANLASRVELGSTRAVRVTTADLRCFSGYCAASCHSSRMVPYQGLTMQPDLGISVFAIVVLILSVIMHEVAHGYAALLFGDQTAQRAGRLTLNPIPHIDLMGSIIVPLLLTLSGSGFLFGWAKPVPYNPYNLRNQRVGEVVVAAAGVFTNFILAVVFGIVARVAIANGADIFAQLSAVVILVNLSLACFNLIPIPPLDGYMVLRGALPMRFSLMLRDLEMRLMRGGAFVLILVLFLFTYFLSTPFYMLVQWLFGLLVGKQ